ncbi:MAG TPA: 4'-phosphopantetheinyl transferase superfamily protein [Kofleriaceae bacterium]|nr:4'-phosphopantetheinyl transferase superfamily protein [Kofleriaceae bacterium]
MVSLAADEAHIWCVDLRHGAAALAACLSADERARVDQLTDPVDRRRFTIARGALRRILAAYLATTADALRFTYGAHGKPALAPGDELHFNLSHADDVACVAVSRAGALGVDVEPVRALESRDALAARFFSPRDRATLAALPAAERDRGFWRCWTFKEAYVKALGAGVTHPLDAFDLAFSEAAPRVIAERVGPVSPWSLHAFEPAVGYVGALAVRASAIRVCNQSWFVP